MRLVGWLASALGVVGVVVSHGLIPVAWMARSRLLQRIRDLLAIPDGGLEIGVGLADLVVERVGAVDGELSAIEGAAQRVAAEPAGDGQAATTLAAAIQAFATGPYAELRANYGRLRERGVAIGEALSGVSAALPFLGGASAAMERISALDAQLQEMDAAVTALARTGPELLADPTIAGRVVERAGEFRQTLAGVTQLAHDIQQRMDDARDGIAERDLRAARKLTLAAIGGTLLALLSAGLHVLLYQQGRRWSGRR